MALTSLPRAAVEVDVDLLGELDFDFAPDYRCDDDDHGDDRPAAVWRVRQWHADGACTTPRTLFLCPEHLKELVAISHLVAICTTCNACAPVREWWELVGGI